VTSILRPLVLLLSAAGGRQRGFTWSLEGQADAAELLDLAREVAARARVEEPGDQT